MHISYLKGLLVLSALCLLIVEMKRHSDFNWIGKMTRDLREQELIVSGIVR